MADWRLLIDGPVEGATNMARDRAVQVAVDGGEAPPTLRLYRWATPTVTLGRFQQLEGLDLQAARELGVDVVRRFTGGRGVLHDDELTYAVVARIEDGVPRGVAASYRHLCAPLAAAYRDRGVDAELTERDRQSAPSAACYLATTRADLSLGAMKLSGSAQVWLGSTVLQHGSFTVTRDVAREARIFRLDEAGEAKLANVTTTIAQASGGRVAFDRIADAVIAGFERSLGVSFSVGELTAYEYELAESLLPQVLVAGSLSAEQS